MRKDGTFKHRRVMVLVRSQTSFPPKPPQQQQHPTSAFTTPHVPKKRLRKGADGVVDHLLNLPSRLHHVWHRLVAVMACWAPQMERPSPST